MISRMAERTSIRFDTLAVSLSIDGRLKASGRMESERATT
jgi:hypothetical protein